MPKRQVKELFEQAFLTPKFILDRNTAFNLTKGSVTALRSQGKDIRSPARKLASAEAYRDEFFVSMANRFNVSVEAMAILLEELNLLE